MRRIYLIVRSFLFFQTKLFYGFLQLFFTLGNTWNEARSWGQRHSSGVARIEGQVPTKSVPKWKKWVRGDGNMGWKPWKIIIENCWEEVSLSAEALILGERKMTFLCELSVLLPYTEQAVLPSNCLSIKLLIISNQISWFFLSTATRPGPKL